MSNNPNFVSELVQMARAFEELPQVQAELDAAKQAIATDADTIQRLELRLIDAKAELDAAHAATRKAEVERDHAETMFLETDDKLNALRRLVTGFQGEVAALSAASEPEPMASAEVKIGASEVDLSKQRFEEAVVGLPPQEVNQAATDAPQAEVNQVPADPTTASPTPATSASLTADVSSESATQQEPQHAPEVAAQPDPTTAPTATSSSDLGTPPVPAIDASVATSSLTDAPGYHNEPACYSPEWYSWAIQMDMHYGVGFWPERLGAPPQAAAQ